MTATPQIDQWTGTFGQEYTARNLSTPPELDAFYRDQYGVSRTEMNAAFLAEIPQDARILEVGCNAGTQLGVLQAMGYTDLHGIEVNPAAVELARSRTAGSTILHGSALNLPFPDASFDLVFTSGVLIHIAPPDVPTAMREIRRCARSYVWGFEYYAPEHREVPYRGHDALLWKGDFARGYRAACPDLTLSAERRYRYRAGENVDSMFLLRLP